MDTLYTKPEAADRFEVLEQTAQIFEVRIIGREIDAMRSVVFHPEGWQSQISKINSLLNLQFDHPPPSITGYVYGVRRAFDTEWFVSNSGGIDFCGYLDDHLRPSTESVAA